MFVSFFLDPPAPANFTAHERCDKTASLVLTWQVR